LSQSSKFYDVIILGAGAAGLLCAFTAARRGRHVLLLEKANRAGKKILMSGGGRCNFTNQVIDADNFISGNPHFCKAALNRYSQWDFINLVQDHGIEYEQRKHDQLFCVHSAKDILGMLLTECGEAGVQIETLADVCNVETKVLPNEPVDTTLFQLEIMQGVRGDGQKSSSTCESLVIATGALSIPTLGGSGFGYDIAKQFGLEITEKRAGLVPLMFSDLVKPICDRLSGLALEVRVTCNGQSFTENLLFTHRGLSGPVILQISNYWFPGDEITIDLLPDMDAAQWLLGAKKEQGKMLLKNLLNHKLARSLVNELQTLWWSASADKPLAGYTDKKLIAIGNRINQWHLKPSASEGYRTAEVTLGGVDTDGISSRTMEAKQQPGLYFIGEVLDVSGHLGGFNFQWAWSSGYSAGLIV